MYPIKIFVPLLAVTALNCTADDKRADEVGLRVTAAIQQQDDLSGIEFRLTPAKCLPNDANVPEDPLVFGVDIINMPMLDGTPFDAADDYDASLIGEDFLPIPAGCYGFIATPLGADGEPLPTCASVERDVVITELAATDLDFVIECGDAVREEVSTNSPPTIDNIAVDPQVSACEATRICATASDPDFDMLEFVWDAPDLLGTVPFPAVISHVVHPDRSITQCIAVQAREAGSYEVGLSVYDKTRFTDDAGMLGELVRIEDETGEQSHASDTVTLDATLGCEPVGRSAVVMLTLDNDPGMAEADANQLIENLVDWVAPDPVSSPTRVLVVLDDAHHGEDADDADFVARQMEDIGYEVTLEVEPSDGLLFADIVDSEVIWFVNPGHPMDDPQTHTALLRYRTTGGGLILQGDDMARFWGAPDMMQPLTYLDWDNNGTVTCGRLTDNNAGANYVVGFEDGGHPIVRGLESLRFEYGNDIDHTTPLGRGEQVFAWASFQSGDCRVTTPVVVGLEPDDLLAWSE